MEVRTVVVVVMSRICCYAGSMKEIKLYNGQEVLVDDEDFDRVSVFSWTISKGYARRTVHVAMVNGKQVTTTVSMHRFILNSPEDKWVDHINGNRLDNRKSNLRLTDAFGNGRNKSRQRNNSSGYIGVSKTRNGKFAAYIMSQGKRYNLGRYKTAEEAAKVRDSRAKELHGEFAKLNS